jgi:hypothetical protein
MSCPHHIGETHQPDWVTFETARSETPDKISCFGFAYIVDKVVSLGKALHLEVNEEDVEESVEEHSKYLTSEDVEELKKQLNQERVKEDKECPSEEEDNNKKGRMPTGDTKNMLHYREEFQSLATKWHPNRAEMNRLCASVEDKCLNHF